MATIRLHDDAPSWDGMFFVSVATNVWWESGAVTATFLFELLCDPHTHTHTWRQEVGCQLGSLDSIRVGQHPKDQQLTEGESLLPAPGNVSVSHM